MKKLSNRVLFGQVAEFRNGLNFSKDSRGSGCILIGIPDFKDRFTPDYASLAEINPIGIAKSDDYIQRNDILFVRSNGNKELVGRSLFIDRDIKALFSGFCIRARIISDEIDPGFCAYFTRTSYFKSSISSHAGTNINNLNQGILGEVELPQFSLASQQKIAAVLSTLDAKIALNQRINGELEGMAKLLYDYWFVQFDFPLSAAQAAALGKPRLAGQPYRSSGGKMVFNPTLKREIPEGWEVDNILVVAELGGGATPSKKKVEFWNGKIPFFTPTDAESEPFCLDTEDHITQEGLSNSSTRLYSEGTLFITARGSVGKAMIISREMAMNQSCYALIPREGVGRAFLYFHTLSLMGFLRAKSSGSVFKSIVTNDIKFTPAIVPDSENLKDFSRFAEPVFNQILNNQQQNQELTTLRDWLLPMLMNGQVRVG